MEAARHKPSPNVSTAHDTISDAGADSKLDEIAARSASVSVAVVDRRQHRHDAVDAPDEVELVGAQLDLRCVRRLVRVVDSGETCELARALTGVEALDVARRADIDRCRHPHLDEAVGRLGGALEVPSPHLVAGVAER